MSPNILSRSKNAAVRIGKTLVVDWIQFVLRKTSKAKNQSPLLHTASGHQSTLCLANRIKIID